MLKVPGEEEVQQGDHIILCAPLDPVGKFQGILLLVNSWQDGAADPVGSKEMHLGLNR